MNAQGNVFIVDDAREIRIALTCMLDVAGYRVHAFESAERFLVEQDCEIPGCLLLDIGLPGMSGMDLQRALAGSRGERPIIFLSGRGDIQTSVQAMKLGAVDFLTKPFDGARLLAAVDQAIRLDMAARKDRAICESIQQRLQVLTRRERQVMAGVVRGQLNKQIAANLGAGEKVVKIHRGRVMKKMEVRSVAELVHLALRIGVTTDITLHVPETAAMARV